MSIFNRKSKSNEQVDQVVEQPQAVQQNEPMVQSVPDIASEPQEVYKPFAVGGRRKSAETTGNPTGPDIENIPLGPRDHRVLSNNNYPVLSHKFDTTYVITRDLKAPTLERPNRILRQTAELNAASSLHACKLIGWRPRKARLLEVREPKHRTIDVRVNGKSVGQMTVDPLIHTMSYSDGCKVMKEIEKTALEADAVKKAVGDKEVYKIVLNPQVFINVVARKKRNKEEGGGDVEHQVELHEVVVGEAGQSQVPVSEAAKAD